jgi:hypothetical protein
LCAGGVGLRDVFYGECVHGEVVYHTRLIDQKNPNR